MSWPVICSADPAMLRHLPGFAAAVPIEGVGTFPEGLMASLIHRLRRPVRCRSCVATLTGETYQSELPPDAELTTRRQR